MPSKLVGRLTAKLVDPLTAKLVVVNLVLTNLKITFNQIYEEEIIIITSAERQLIKDSRLSGMFQS